jgi:hypothetical protein
MRRAAAQSNDNSSAAEVTANSRALDLEPKVFERESAEEIAPALKRSADTSEPRKSGAFRSAVPMLTFHINRVGRNLSPERARGDLRRERVRSLAQFGHAPSAARASNPPHARQTVRLDFCKEQITMPISENSVRSV